MNKTLKWIGCTLGLLLLLILTIIVFSPYGTKRGFQDKLIVEKISINVPVEQVYDYLGNSANANKWSSFVRHISTLNSADFKDGSVGSVRRCFAKEIKEGMRWDEKVLINEHAKRRRLNIFNMREFLVTEDNLLTEQLFLSLSSDKCELSLTLFFETEKASWYGKLKMYFVAYYISSVFKANLHNIKILNEN